MPADVIDRVHILARRHGASADLYFAARDGTPMGDCQDDDDDDEDYYLDDDPAHDDDDEADPIAGVYEDVEVAGVHPIFDEPAGVYPIVAGEIAGVHPIFDEPPDEGNDGMMDGEPDEPPDEGNDGMMDGEIVAGDMAEGNGGRTLA
jgi:hypothetical protein